MRVSRVFAQNSETSFSGNLDNEGTNEYSMTGTLSANGQSVSNGTFSTAASGANLVVCSQSAPSTFTAYVVPPISGTFTGTLDASNGVQDQASI